MPSIISLPTIDLPGIYVSAAGRIVLPNRRSSLTLLSEWVQEFALANKLSGRSAFRLEILLVETVTNIIEHGKRDSDFDDDECSAIEVQAARSGAHVVVQVEDDGSPFDPTAAPKYRPPATLAEAPVGGLGLHLIRCYTEEWEYRRINQRNRQRMMIACDS